MVGVQKKEKRFVVMVKIDEKKKRVKKDGIWVSL